MSDWNPKSLVGFTLGTAVQVLEAHGLPWRLVSEDGVAFPLSQDYRPERQNLVVDAGRVTSISRG